MKKSVLVIGTVFLILLFGIAAKSAELNVQDDSVRNASPADTLEIRQLLLQRTQIMNEYFAGNRKLGSAAEELAEIEDGVLYVEDLIGMEIYENTDIDTVESCDIEVIRIINQGFSPIHAAVKIKWTVHGLDGRTVFTENYMAVCEKRGKTLKLVEFF